MSEHPTSDELRDMDLEEYVERARTSSTGPSPGMLVEVVDYARRLEAERDEALEALRRIVTEIESERESDRRTLEEINFTTRLKLADLETDGDGGSA